MNEYPFWKRLQSGRYGRRRFLAAGGGAAAGLAALLVGCAGDDDDDDQAAQTSTGTATSPAATSETTTPSEAETEVPEATETAGSLPGPGEGGVLRGHDNGDPLSFDLVKTFSYRTGMTNSLTYPRLLKYQVGPNVDPIAYNITSDLAESMPEQPDELTYVFSLQQAQWEDKAPLNGRALVADDVVASWQRFVEAHVFRYLFTDVTSVEATDDQTVTFALSKPLGLLPSQLAHQGMFYVYPGELLEGQLEQDMWSAGPFIFREYETGSRIRFERNPNYFVPDRPLLQEFTIEIIPDAATATEAMRSRQIDTLLWTSVVTPRDVESLQGDLPDATFLKYARQQSHWLGLDLTNPVFQDKRVRQAISMSLNRDDQVQVYGEALWSLPYGVLQQFYFDPKENAFPNAGYYHYNPEEARALLEAAGVEDFATFELITSNVWTPFQVQETQVIQQYLSEIGIETNIKQLEFAEFYASLQQQLWEGGMIVGAGHIGTDPNEYLTANWDPAPGKLLVAPGLPELIVDDTELIKAIDAQRRELDSEARVELVRECVDILADRMYNAPTVVDVSYHVHQANVKNLDWIFTYSPGPEYLLESYVEA